MDLPIDHQHVTATDFQPVFRVLAVIDGHQRTADDVAAWMLAARSGRWTRAQLAAGTLALTASWTGFRIRPGDMTDQVRTLRAKVRARWSCPDPPRELAEDPAAEVRWRRHAAADFTDRALLALADGADLDDVPLLAAAQPERPRLLLTEARPEVRAAVEEVLPTVGSLPEPRPAPRRAPRAAMDPARRAEARAELDARRPADTTTDLREDATA